MRHLSDAFAAHIASGSTTLCWCWQVARRDGVVLGFTDHDRDIAFNGTTYRAESGLNASDMRQSVGLHVDNFDVQSALSASTITDADLANGLFDAARITIFRVNWQDVSERLLVRSGEIGEVTRQDNAFTAEVRGLSHALQQQRGRLYQYTCDADLGDSRCSIDITTSDYHSAGVVAGVLDQRRFRVSGISEYPVGWFSRGLLTWTGGPNVDAKIEVKGHVRTAEGDTLEIWRAPALSIEAGQTFKVTAGCDKQFSTCRDRFANALNFRGFPHMPGNDFVTSIPTAGDAPQGGKTRA